MKISATGIRVVLENLFFFFFFFRFVLKIEHYNAIIYLGQLLLLFFFFCILIFGVFTMYRLLHSLLAKISCNPMFNIILVVD